MHTIVCIILIWTSGLIRSNNLEYVDSAQNQVKTPYFRGKQHLTGGKI